MPLFTESPYRPLLILTTLLGILLPGGLAAMDGQAVQQPEPSEVGIPLLPAPSSRTQPPVTITLQDALARARRNYAPYLSALTDATIAHEDTVQVRAILLPSLAYSQQYLGTEGNGKLASGRFVAQDGCMFTVWGAFYTKTCQDSLQSRRTDVLKRVSPWHKPKQN